MIPAPTLVLANVAEALRDDEIHVWLVRYDASFGRLPLREVLGRYLRTSSDRVQLVDGEHGRPALAEAHDRSLDFNWSHSGDRALIAVARHAAPGVDLERVRPRQRALAIAERFFRPDEAAALAALPDEDRTLAFLEMWTAKEALVKALGRGIAFGLDRFSVGRTSDGQLRLHYLHDDDVREWQLHRLAPSADLVAALAWRGEQRHIRSGTLVSAE